MNLLLAAIAQEADVQSVISGVRAGLKEQMISGLAGSSRQALLAALVQELNRPLLVVAHNMFSAQKIAEDLAECAGAEVLLYPANELMIVESVAASPETLAQRIEVLSRLAAGFRGIVVVPFSGLRKLQPAKEAFASANLQLAVGDVMDPGTCAARLHELGYERVEKTENRGEMSVRGGIIDVFPLTTEKGYRIEWFDDTVDSIRLFDVADQRSVEKIRSVQIPPCKEIIAEPRRARNCAQHVYERLEEYLAKIADRKTKEKLLAEIGKDIELLREGVCFREIYKYISFLYPERQTLLDYMPDDTILALDEPVRLQETAKQLEREEAEMVTSLLQEGKFLPALQLSKDYTSLIPFSGMQKLYLSLFLRQVQHAQPQNIVNIVSRSMQHFHGQMHVLKAEMERWDKAGAKVMIVAGGEERAQRVRRVLEDYKIKLPILLNGYLQAGFELPSIKLVVITENELFTQKQRKARKVERKIENAERIKSYTDLKVGDYVVHVNHGIGKFVGIGTLEIAGMHKDYIHIVYAGGDKLSVPIDQIDMVQKYIGTDDKEPKLYKLGGNEWHRVKNKVRSSVKDIAGDLIKLYAQRMASTGYAFAKDTPYQKDFESMFPYEETPDQLRAIEEIKRDMEKSRPMDRLLCGDVGYGKTEVAIRAAFKAAIEGKQVAVLVPTTILAQQHFETFRERFSGFPMRIEVISRFRSKKQQTEIVKGIKNGTVDIIIGTHRLLSSDVRFKDLGLLIVDEEQRFGVTHKEKLKRLKANVDVLTLTATPIPRTLHMSMLGVRDLSIIETPPENRYPVQTYVVEYSNSLVREAIERELARNGQVYVLYNRVQGIQSIAERISTLVPEARVAVGHGQMSEQELEKTILDFLDGEYDVLVSTTIIETGVDIPNVNTLILFDADKMGLSQLYQLRGRVGRSNRIAYAYFTYERDKVLSEVSEKRLEAIKQFTELGSGFKIAMRDLAIRGAGNLLGAEQHGFIASVGFDLYSQMLADEIKSLKSEMEGEQAPPVEINTQIDIQLDAYIPSDYIYDSMQKIEVYKRVVAIQRVEEAEELYEELVDRFGDLPQPVETLLAVARIKALGKEFFVESIAVKGAEAILKIHESQNALINGQKLFELGNRLRNKMRLISGLKIQIALNIAGMKPEETIAFIEQFLLQYREVVNPKGELENVAK
ncbi:MAG TPA: transcription-repair coupling factor [Bacilli bacterium]